MKGFWFAQINYSIALNRKLMHLFCFLEDEEGEEEDFDEEDDDDEEGVEGEEEDEVSGDEEVNSFLVCLTQ